MEDVWKWHLMYNKRKETTMEQHTMKFGQYTVKLYIPANAETVVYIWEAEDITASAEKRMEKALQWLFSGILLH